MQIKDENTLNLFRGEGRCEACGEWCRSREAAHIFARGMGGGGRLDLPFNLVALGSCFACACHSNSHCGLWPGMEDLLAVAAKRERTTAEEIRRAVRDIRRLPKASSRETVLALYPRTT